MEQLIKLYQAGQFNDADKRAKALLQANPNSYQLYNIHGAIQAANGQLDQAIVSYRYAIKLKPDYAQAYYNLGNALKKQGNHNEAIASYKQAIKLKPDFTSCFCNLSTVMKFDNTTPELASMESIYALKDLSAEDRIHIAFALGKAHDDLKQYDKAFKYILTGNTLKRESIHYDLNNEINQFNFLKSVFNTKLFTKNKCKGIQDAPVIFIVGMPRSGTTLTEQILASHPKVYGAGELKYLANIYNSAFASFSKDKLQDKLQRITESELSTLGNDYLNSIKENTNDNQHITNKMPYNFRRIGFIKLLFPNAKVIHCQRNPLDNCASLFNHYFEEGQEYSYDLNELGQYYNLYQDLMQHWHQVLPGFIYDLSYESLVADTEGKVRALLEYCELPWDDACLEFHKNKRAVQTASATQVRQPIYKGSIERWKNYEKGLTPLLDIINMD